MFRKEFSVATIGLLLASLFAVITPTAAQVPAPADYKKSEYAWLKEDGLPPETWKQYNNTGWNRLNLSYRYSRVNIAYVVRSSASSDNFNVTFIVFLNNTGCVFNKTGHFRSGSANTSVWTVKVRPRSTQTIGQYTYHLYIATYNPQGAPGIYEVRINATAPGVGSSWVSPAGNPAVQWMFFFVPTVTPDIVVTDQLGRPQPFYLDGPSPSTKFNATMVIKPPGNSTGATTATVEWMNTKGVVIMTRTVPIYYVGGGQWAAQNVVAANTTAFPFNATDPYGVRITMGYFVRSGTFYVLSTLWVQVTIDVTPIKNQWFDPSSFLVTFTARVNTGMSNNPYQSVWNISLQFWDNVHYTVSGARVWRLGAVLANLSWNITGYTVISGSSYTYTYTVMIPAKYIDNTTDRLGEFFGDYEIRSVPIARFPAVTAKKAFYVDDPIEGYTSRTKAAPLPAVAIFEQKPATVWANVEFDPTYTRSPHHTNAVYKDKKTNITWYYPTPPTLLKPPGNYQTTMTQDAGWPSSQFWAFSSALINVSRPINTYWIIVNATTDNSYVVREKITYRVVFKALYLKIWPKWAEYQPCMKKSIIGKTYYLDEFDNEVAVDWGFFIYQLVDPKGVVYSEPTESLGGYVRWSGGMWYDEWAPFPWTYTKKIAPSTQALGAIWDDLPSDAELGTWTVYAMALNTSWKILDVQDIPPYSFQGPVTCTFKVKGEDVHLMIDDILKAINDTSTLTWSKLAEVMTKLTSISSQITSLKDTEIKSIITKVDAAMSKLTSMDTNINAKLSSLEEYAREIRALTSRIDRWRTDFATDMAGQFTRLLTEIGKVNSNVDKKWTDLASLWQITFYGVSERDPRSLVNRIAEVRTAALAAVTDGVKQIVDKVDKVDASLGAKLTNVINAIASEAGALDDSMKATIKANIEYAISNIRSKIDSSSAEMASKIAASSDGLNAKFAGVISEIGYVGAKVDAVEAKLGGVQTNIEDKVDAVDASVGTKLLVAIILIVIVLILCLLPIVAPGFRMKE